MLGDFALPGGVDVVYRVPPDALPGAAPPAEPPFRHLACAAVPVRAHCDVNRAVRKALAARLEGLRRRIGQGRSFVEVHVVLA
jgi:hypothetical protein